MQCPMMTCTPSGRSGRALRTGTGSVCRMSPNTSPVDSLPCPNGSAPVSSSYKMTPSAQTSLRGSTDLDSLICSGDM